MWNMLVSLAFLVSVVHGSLVPRVLVSQPIAIDLGAGVESRADALNDRGQIIGESRGTFLWQAGTHTLVPYLGAKYIRVYDVNNRGYMVGWNRPQSGIDHAALWRDGTMVNLGNLGGYSEARDINDRDQVVGFSYIAKNRYHAVLWQDNRIIDLGALGGTQSAAMAINNLGDIVGETRKYQVPRAYFWQNGKKTDIGTLGGNMSTANDINDRRQVVGVSTTASGEGHAYVWEPGGVMTDIGTLGGTFSYAYAINEHGQIVGESQTATGQIHAFLWSPATGMIDLGTLGGARSSAYDVNEHGWVVGYSTTTVANEYRATLWKVPPAGARSTQLVSQDHFGTAANGISGGMPSRMSAVSGDGRFVAFESHASDLVEDDGDVYRDIFVRDTVGGTTTRVSVDALGSDANGPSTNPSISADGRFVAFELFATNLVPGDTNELKDVFVYDRKTNTMERISVSSAGVQGNRSSVTPTLSADGRFISFGSNATNLVAGDTNNVRDIFVHDRQQRTTTRITNDRAPQANGHSDHPVISENGQVVVFSSYATNLVPNDQNGSNDIFAYDRSTATVSLITSDATGRQSDNHSYNPWVSNDGRYISFQSYATNLVPGDTNGRQDVFVYDQIERKHSRVSVDSAGVQGNRGSTSPAISADGRWVTFTSDATNLIASDTNQLTDVFLHDRVSGLTERVSVGADGLQANGVSSAPVVNADGTAIVFNSWASNLVADDSNGFLDVYIHTR